MADEVQETQEPAKPEPARTGIGDIAVELLDSKGELKALTLKPSLQACQALSRINGGLVNLSSRVSALDLDSIVTVLAYGLGYGGTKRPPKDFEERVYRTGLVALSTPCTQFVNIVANGGKPLADKGSEPEGEDSGGQNPP